jgi:hypothetical protein
LGWRRWTAPLFVGGRLLSQGEGKTESPSTGDVVGLLNGARDAMFRRGSESSRVLGTETKRGHISSAKKGPKISISCTTKTPIRSSDRFWKKLDSVGI